MSNPVQSYDHMLLPGVAVEGIDPAAALEVLPRECSRYDWHRIRRQGIGGSDASAVLGMSKYRSAIETWSEKVNDATPVDDDDLLEDDSTLLWGRLLEPVVRDRFCFRQGVTMRYPGTLQSQRWPWMFANLDGLGDDLSVYEGKTASTYVSSDWDDGIVADHAEIQAQHNMAVTGLDHAWVVVLIGGNDMRIRWVARDDDLIADLVEMEREFWFDHVVADEMPPPDHSDAAKEFLSKRYPVSDEQRMPTGSETRDYVLAAYRQGKAGATYGQDEDAAKNQVRALLGDHEELFVTDPDGNEETLATWKSNGAFDEKKCIEENPDETADFMVKVEKLDRKAFEKKHPDLYKKYRSRVLLIKDKASKK